MLGSLIESARNDKPPIEGESFSIDYAVSGTGPTVVLVPGSCSTGAAWQPVIAAWAKRFRCVTTSLLGYGRTAERRTAADADIAHEAEAVESVIWRAGGGAHVVGHSFGGLVAIAVALRKRVPLASLTIIEAPAVELLRAADEHRHYRAFRQMSDAYFAAYRRGETHAIASMIDFYGGADTFGSWPRRVREYAVRTTPVNLLDWAGAYGFALSPAVLAKIDNPTLVLMGSKSHPAVRRANELLSMSIPGGYAVSIAGATHFMMATHARDVARLIGRHVASADAWR